MVCSGLSNRLACCDQVGIGKTMSYYYFILRTLNYCRISFFVVLAGGGFLLTEQGNEINKYVGGFQTTLSGAKF